MGWNAVSQKVEGMGKVALHFAPAVAKHAWAAIEDINSMLKSFGHDPLTSGRHIWITGQHQPVLLLVKQGQIKTSSRRSAWRLRIKRQQSLVLAAVSRQRT